MEDIQTSINTEPDTQPEDDGRPPLWKQVLGAVIGGGLALALYYGYEYAKPQVVAYLTLPAAEGGRMYDLGASHLADKTMDAGNRKRLLSRNLRAAGMLKDNTANDPSLLESVDNHSLDIAWPGHDKDDINYAEAIEEDKRPGVPIAVAEKVDEWEKDIEDQNFKVDIMEEEMATQNMDTEDAWEDLWGDIHEREDGSEHSVESSNANALPDTGFGIGFVAIGAAGGAWGARKKKKRNTK
ncbi:MAG: hypothetical protein QF793_03045 [Candidatus Peribacteraceae bacterium]|jgi:hypothetical protein|nr:hypothetical protein [bacterium]MDP6561879.1 hypothetical protein [Candidatus Peribacteraceae bacterium]|tara:strand:+ start:6216 stop:6935 length:720 start_codon:yes stop_codon:yes gene_type:complete